MDPTVPFACPQCKYSQAIKVREMAPGRSTSCRRCKTTIRFTGADGRRVQRELDKLQEFLKKPIRIRL